MAKKECIRCYEKDTKESIEKYHGFCSSCMLYLIEKFDNIIQGEARVELKLIKGVSSCEKQKLWFFVSDIFKRSNCNK